MNSSKSSSRRIRGKQALKGVLQTTPRDTPVVLKASQEDPVKRKKPSAKTRKSMGVQDREDDDSSVNVRGTEMSSYLSLLNSSEDSVIAHPVPKKKSKLRAIAEDSQKPAALDNSPTVPKRKRSFRLKNVPESSVLLKHGLDYSSDDSLLGGKAPRRKTKLANRDSGWSIGLPSNVFDTEASEETNDSLQNSKSPRKSKKLRMVTDELLENLFQSAPADEPNNNSILDKSLDKEQDQLEQSDLQSSSEKALQKQTQKKNLSPLDLTASVFNTSSKNVASPSIPIMLPKASIPTPDKGSEEMVLSFSSVEPDDQGPSNKSIINRTQEATSSRGNKLPPLDLTASLFATKSQKQTSPLPSVSLNPNQTKNSDGMVVSFSSVGLEREASMDRTQESSLAEKGMSPKAGRLPPLDLTASLFATKSQKQVSPSQRSVSSNQHLEKNPAEMVLSFSSVEEEQEPLINESVVDRTRELESAEKVTSGKGGRLPPLDLTASLFATKSQKQDSPSQRHLSSSQDQEENLDGMASSFASTEQPIASVSENSESPSTGKETTSPTTRESIRRSLRSSKNLSDASIHKLVRKGSRVMTSFTEDGVSYVLESMSPSPGRDDANRSSRSLRSSVSGSTSPDKNESVKIATKIISPRLSSSKKMRETTSNQSNSLPGSPTSISQKNDKHTPKRPQLISESSDQSSIGVSPSSGRSRLGQTTPTSTIKGNQSVRSSRISPNSTASILSSASPHESPRRSKRITSGLMRTINNSARMNESIPATPLRSENNRSLKSTPESPGSTLISSEDPDEEEINNRSSEIHPESVSGKDEEIETFSTPRRFSQTKNSINNSPRRSDRGNTPKRRRSSLSFVDNSVANTRKSTRISLLQEPDDPSSEQQASPIQNERRSPQKSLNRSKTFSKAPNRVQEVLSDITAVGESPRRSSGIITSFIQAEVYSTTHTDGSIQRSPSKSKEKTITRSSKSPPKSSRKIVSFTPDKHQSLNQTRKSRSPRVPSARKVPEMLHADSPARRRLSYKRNLSNSFNAASENSPSVPSPARRSPRMSSIISPSSNIASPAASGTSSPVTVHPQKSPQSRHIPRQKQLTLEAFLNRMKKDVRPSQPAIPTFRTKRREIPLKHARSTTKPKLKTPKMIVPPSYHKNVMTHFSKHKITNKGIDEVNAVAEKFLASMSSDLRIASSSRNANVVTSNDCYRLMKQLGIVKSENHMHCLIQQYLPMEMWENIVPTTLPYGKSLP